MRTGRSAGVIVDFIVWFEKKYPGEKYELDHHESGTRIIRKNGQIITYLEFFEHKLTSEYWRPVGESQQSKY